MTAVGRFNKDSGGAAPKASAGLRTLRRRVLSPSDFWDRPDGCFGPLDDRYSLDAPGRQQANSMFRLGSKALLRDELAAAADLLGVAAAAGHPGALFRLAVVALRSGAGWREDAWFLVAEAARHGHGDARRLLTPTDGDGMDVDQVEDEVFFEEISAQLGQPPTPHTEAEKLDAAQDPVERLILVPAPALPPLSGPAPNEEGTAGRGQPLLTALPGGLALPVPELKEAPASGHGPVLPGGEPWWSANALRPAALTRMQRASFAPAVIPSGWQATQRARDLVVLIHQSGGLDTRALARRTRMPLNAAVRLLDWLRAQRFVISVEGVHFPGPLMALAAKPDPERTLLTQALAELRDDLGAAVYISAYTDGEIIIQQSSSSANAPAVRERAPFSVTGHASAVGKSLLAQLAFPAHMDHLSRYPSVQLTERTITSKDELFERLDDHGPHSAQFDLLEYSDSELCVAFSLGLPGRASSIAISLPLSERERLIDTAEVLSRRATGLLLVHLLADDLYEHSAGTQTPERWSPPRRALP
ncbi:IclR family transcriptional regulator C-terminal domain-containing protein [Streptomyces sp. NPDC048266]|uniref:IclR family transcriptional regulator domain-containing protein n=1 Tax=Streptomyces sp. NPDC048266 TaxID=3155787 RepID=UPI0033FA4B90